MNQNSWQKTNGFVVHCHQKATNIVTVTFLVCLSFFVVSPFPNNCSRFVVIKPKPKFFIIILQLFFFNFLLLFQKRDMEREVEQGHAHENGKKRKENKDKFLLLREMGMYFTFTCLCVTWLYFVSLAFGWQQATENGKKERRSERTMYFLWL